MSLVNPMDPMALLQMRAGAIPTPTPNPGPSAAPVSASSASTAPAPDGPSAGAGSGALGFLGNIGSRLGAALQGDRGLFASAPDAKADAVVDPMTGVPAGMSRRANNQAIMKMGLLLMSAGMRQSDDSRAQLLAGLPAAMDTSGTLNDFAKNRLEMSKMRLLEKQQLAEEARQKALYQMLGISMPTPSEGGPGGAPAATGGAPGAMPPIPAVGAPGSAPMASPASGGMLPPASAGGAPTASPVAGAPQAMPLDTASLPTTPPPAPDLGAWAPSKADMIAGMGAGDSAGMAKVVADSMTRHSSKEVQTSPYLIPSTGQVAVDIYKGGTKIRTDTLGKVDDRLVAEQDPATGATTYRKVNANGQVTDVDIVRDPISDDARKAEIKTVTEDRDALRTDYKDVVKPALASQQRLTAIYEDVAAGKIVMGTGSDARRAGLNVLATLGWATPEQVEKLVNTQKAYSELGLETAQTAAEYFKPVTNFELEQAKEITGAALSNNPEVIRATIGRMIARNNSAIASYNERAGLHNEVLGEFKLNQRLYSAQVEDYTPPDIGAIDARYPTARQQAAGAVVSGDAVRAEGRPAVSGTPQRLPGFPTPGSAQPQPQNSEEELQMNVGNAAAVLQQNPEAYGTVLNRLLAAGYTRDQIKAAGFPLKD